jgi:hypothetical protein
MFHHAYTAITHVSIQVFEGLQILAMYFNLQNAVDSRPSTTCYQVFYFKHFNLF